jgi:hypothetical protein
MFDVFSILYFVTVHSTTSSSTYIPHPYTLILNWLFFFLAKYSLEIIYMTKQRLSGLLVCYNTLKSFLYFVIIKMLKQQFRVHVSVCIFYITSIQYNLLLIKI